MKTRPGLVNGVSILCVATLGLSVLVARASGEAPTNPKLLPHVVKAEAPLYPPILQKAHIEGLVRLRVTTDGKRPSTITTIEGQAMLARAATENVQTWELDGRSATTFDTRFEYRLLESHCDPGCTWCGSTERPTVLLRLPSDVRVEAEAVTTCDPVTGRGDK